MVHGGIQTIEEAEAEIERQKAWATFLAAYVDYHHGKGISDHAWDCFQQGKGPFDD